MTECYKTTTAGEASLSGEHEALAYSHATFPCGAHVHTYIPTYVRICCTTVLHVYPTQAVCGANTIVCSVACNSSVCIKYGAVVLFVDIINLLGNETPEC